MVARLDGLVGQGGPAAAMHPTHAAATAGTLLRDHQPFFLLRISCPHSEVGLQDMYR